MPDVDLTDLFEKMLPRHVEVRGFVGGLKYGPMGMEPASYAINAHMYGPVRMERHLMMKMTEPQIRAYAKGQVVEAKLGLARLLDEMAMKLRKGI